MNGPRFWGAATRTALQSVARVPLLAAVMILTACGGGGYGSSSKPPSKTMSTVGTITRFSTTSMTVNGTQFQMAAATVSVDGKQGQESDLHTGDVVEVKSHHDDASGADVADQVDFRDSVQGPVTRIDPTTQTLIVLGQTVILSATTSFDDQISPPRSPD